MLQQLFETAMPRPPRPEKFEPNWPKIDFPSDHLSVKRLRKLFPALFDSGSAISDGYSSFFDPSNDEFSKHLERLNDLISYERTIVDFGYHKARNVESIDDMCRRERAEAKEKLEPLYIEFRLANSFSDARMLIQHLEDQGAEQGKDRKARSR